MSAVSTYLLQSLVGLLLLAALGGAFVWWARRAGVTGHEGPLRLLGRLQLDPKRAVYVVRVGEVAYVLGASEGTLSKLGEVPASALPDAGGTEVAPLVLPFVRRSLVAAGPRGDGREDVAS